MLATMTGILLTLSGTGATQWHDAWETAESPVEIREAGDYTVWVWVYKGESPEVSLNDMVITFDDFESSDEEAQWVSGNKLALEKGAAQIAVGEGVASVVLTTDRRWKPEAALPLLRVSSSPEGPRDSRVYKRKGTNTIFKMTDFASRDDWESFAERLRRKILTACGLWPMPEKTPLNAKIFGRVEHEDYTVEKVHFEVFPGFLVTGNLYRPVSVTERVPGVACPHGHWENGRLEDGERGSVPARGITLARMGMTAFTYDMVGYNDSLQLSHKWESEAEKLWGIHPFAIQLLSSIRVLDFLESLPEVDPEQLVCTGASGGGTQTFALAAVDPRVKIAAPVNMISSTMQGGCICENAPLIRLNNSNMEIGALMAPRPMLMVSATGDWTKKTPEVEYPAIRSIYALYGAEDRLEEQQIDAPHNYNLQSREAVYRFFGKRILEGEDWDTFAEPPYELEGAEALRVFPEGKLPEGYEKGEPVIQSLIEARRAQVAKDLAGMNSEQRAERQEAFRDMLHLNAPVADAEGSLLGETHIGGYRCQSWTIGRHDRGEAIPILLFLPEGDATVSTVDLMLSDRGKNTFLDLDRGALHPALEPELTHGHAVALVEPFWTGEHRTWHQQRERNAATDGFYDTFEPTDTARRVQDVLSAVAFLADQLPSAERFVLTADGDAGVWALLAGPFDDRIAKVNTDWVPGTLDEAALWTRNYVPSIRSLGGLDAALLLFRGDEN